MSIQRSQYTTVRPGREIEYTWTTRGPVRPMPGRVFDQHFGIPVEEDDLAPPSSVVSPSYYVRPARRLSRGISQIENTADRFLVRLDVNQFAPEQIIVKTVDNAVVIHAKHEEQVDDHGFVSREFSRRYILPDDAELENVSSSLTADGILTIEAPKRVVEKSSANERIVTIVRQPLAAAAVQPAIEEKAV